MKKIILIMMVSFLMLGLCACGAIRNRIVDTLKSAAADITMPPMETAGQIEDTTDPEETEGQVSTALPEETAAPEATQASGGLEGFWPEDVPADVPVFKHGKYMEESSGKMEYEGNMLFTMVFSGVKKEQVEEYYQALDNAGYEVTKSEIAGSFIMTGSLKKNSKELCSILITWSEETGDCSIILTITEDK